MSDFEKLEKYWKDHKKINRKYWIISIILAILLILPCIALILIYMKNVCIILIAIALIIGLVLIFTSAWALLTQIIHDRFDKRILHELNKAYEKYQTDEIKIR